MKKSNFIQLVLITSALASCNKPKSDNDWEYGGSKTYIRSDSTAPYTKTRHYRSNLLWHYAFRPYGCYNNGYYNKSGYYSSAISERSNIGSNAIKSATIRGGFGGHSFFVSS